MPNIIMNTLRRIRLMKACQEDSPPPLPCPHHCDEEVNSCAADPLHSRSASPAFTHHVHPLGSPQESSTTLPDVDAQRTSGFTFEEAQYAKFGPLQSVRHLRTISRHVGIRDNFAAQFDSQTGALLQVYNLEGAVVTGPHTVEFVVAGPHFGPPWRLRATSAVEAVEWCQAFNRASRTNSAPQERPGRPRGSFRTAAENTINEGPAGGIKVCLKIFHVPI